MELNEPSGWVRVPMGQDGRFDVQRSYSGSLIPFLHSTAVKTFLVQIAVLSNHQNGRDTHMRLVNVYAPKRYDDLYTYADPMHSKDLPHHTPFHGEEFAAFCSLR